MSVSQWQKALDRYLDQYGIDAIIKKADSSSQAPIKVHFSKFNMETLVNDVSQAKRKGITSITELAGYGEPVSGDKIEYLNKTVTIDFVDPRIEAGGIIGYDLILRGDN